MFMHEEMSSLSLLFNGLNICYHDLQSMRVQMYLHRFRQIQIKDLKRLLYIYKSHTLVQCSLHTWCDTVCKDGSRISVEHVQARCIDAN